MTERPGVEQIARLDDLWANMWEDLRHNATGKPSGAAIVAKWRPIIEASALRAAAPAPPEPDETRVFDSPDEMFDAIRALAAPSGPALDADVLGMALDLVDEEDGRVGVVGRGRKVDRVVVEYERLREGSAET